VLKESVQPLADLLAEKYNNISSVVNNITARKGSVAVGEQEIRTFTITPKSDTPLTFRVTTGNPPVTSALIQLNQKTIFAPDDFKAAESQVLLFL
jgi:hypothetical protein